MITATAIGNRLTDRGIFLQQNVVTEEVTELYFKSPLYGTNEGVAIIDIIGSSVVYFLNRRKKNGRPYSGGSLDYNVIGNSPMTRFAKIYKNRKGVLGWSDCRGRFHKL